MESSRLWWGRSAGVLIGFLFLAHLASGLRPLLPYGTEFVKNPTGLLRRSLEDGAFSPDFSPASGPSPLPQEASAISPSGGTLQAPIGASDSGHSDGGGHHMRKGVLAAIILVPTLVCASILLSSYISLDSLRPRLAKVFGKDEGYSDPPTPLPPYHGGGGPVQIKTKRSDEPAKPAQVMDYKMLESATDRFSEENLIGEGGFARVYKAQLDDDHAIAVKKLSTENDQADEEFRAEIDLMGRIHHHNLIALLGFSSQGEDRLLIYELMTNGSLQDQLQGPAQGAALTWHLRLKIALDAARGLEYLHDHCDPPVIHRDFKSSNILLDEDFNAKLSDFGLALMVQEGAGSLQLQGTFGYVAPEYILTGILTEKSDVYAFGVVLLELITGRKPIDVSMPTGCQSLVTWATPQLTDRTRLPLIVDAAIKDTVNLKQLFQVAAVAVLCVQSEPSYRPLIGDVVNSLIPLVPCELGGALRAIDPAGATAANSHSQHGV
ncbi:probable receptor-like protein kinase At1g80640 isoform X1 [Selaginella moellendorffii]|nr:probable receptor-like protein kinase At1g80640 isoform X1 [Selaginella moellendorffii]|eukprot:XP_002985113.2 probable receptor-like protein kinase At1g80640 isoform X1 [Selaginella moellendorffii]